MLIGLHGKKQAGKDTVFARAGFLMRDVIVVERASFADLLYKSAAAALGVTVAELQEWKSNPDVRVVVTHTNAPEALDLHYVVKARQTVREYLQRYGTEAHREVFGTDFWVDQVRLGDHDGRIVMVTDVRFPNEARAVRSAGGLVVHVLGPAAIENTGDGHASEEPLPAALIDDVLVNATRDDDFRALDTQVDHLLRRLLKRKEAA
jgi:hypothetical protein